MKNIRKKMENKGFTLVEIIVCLAIMTIVAGSVGAFIVAGNNSYLRGNKELTLQEEAQLAANQMIDLIIDVEKDIKFTNTTGTAVDLDGNPACTYHCSPPQCGYPRIQGSRWRSLRSARHTAVQRWGTARGRAAAR